MDKNKAKMRRELHNLEFVFIKQGKFIIEIYKSNLVSIKDQQHLRGTKNIMNIIFLKGSPTQ